MTAPPRVTLGGLDAAIEHNLVGTPKGGTRRLLGLELERLILHRETRQAAPLTFCRTLLRDLAQDLGADAVEESGVLAKMRAGDFGISMEPGGQLEFDSDPLPNIAALDEVFGRGTAVIERRLDGTPYELVALGHTPVTPVAELGLLPRPRYHIMDASMPKRGNLTRNMMRATAGLQMTCDFVDRADAGRRLALVNRLSPVLMALCANSREAEGRDTGDASYRHRVWWHTDTTRTGVPEGTLDAETAVDGYVRFARRAIALFGHGPDDLVPLPEVPFEDLVADGGVSQADLDLHMSSLFPLARLRNYIEIRCFDTVEWPLARSVLGLVSGVIYCDKATRAAEELSAPLAIRDPEALRAFHLDAARSGLDTRVPAGGPSFRDIAGELVGFASSTLGGVDCDWARVDDLQAVRDRIASGA